MRNVLGVFPRVSAVLSVLLTSSVLAAPAAPNVTREPAREMFLLIPLHVHLLSCKDRADIDCKLIDEDVRRIVGKVNGVWHKAGIHFCLESILHEDAENVKVFLEKQSEPVGPLGPPLQIYRMLAPEKTRGLAGLHVYYVHQLPPNGVYLGQNVCFVKETAALRKVEGGIDEPLPRVTSHELGHGLSLPHRQDTTNLMASGTTGTLLNQTEVGVARQRARKLAGVMTFEAFQQAIEDAKSNGDTRRAAALARYLDELPD